MTIFFLILAVLAIMSASLSGVVLLWSRLGKSLPTAMPYLISASAGLFVVVCYSLYQETFELLSPQSGLMYMAIGFIGFTLFTLLMPDGHHHIDDDHHDHAGMAKRILAGDAVHNIADGILLVPAFLIDVRLGVATAAGVFLHEFIQELSEFIILKDAGYSTKKALLWNFAVAGTVIIGVLIGAAVTHSDDLVGPILGISAGAFAFLVVYDLFPRMFSESKRAKKSLIVLSFVSGAVLLLLLQNVIGHGHEHEDHEHEEDLDHVLGEVMHDSVE